MSCKCQGCGKQYKIDVIVNDNLWEQIKPKNKPIGGGLLCGACIFERLEISINDYDATIIKLERNEFKNE